MGASVGGSAARDSLIGREADAIVASLTRSHPRELSDNPEGVEVPSNWRRTGGDLPELLAAGYREIYVPQAAAADAQALLATLETPDSEQDAAPTRRIGLERTGLRLIGKATALLVVAGILVGLVLGLVTEEPTVGLVALAAILIAGAGLLVWSERAARG